MSSLDSDVVSASEFQDYIFGHWEVENCLHLQKDKEYGEDKHVCGAAWTVLTNMAVSLVNLLHQGERTLREVRERCGADPLSAARKLGWKT
jgi:predicted transposase YbfD/YdcC